MPKELTDFWYKWVAWLGAMAVVPLIGKLLGAYDMFALPWFYLVWAVAAVIAAYVLHWVDHARWAFLAAVIALIMCGIRKLGFDLYAYDWWAYLIIAGAAYVLGMMMEGEERKHA